MDPYNKRSNRSTSPIAIGLAVVALVAALYAINLNRAYRGEPPQPTPKVQGLLDRISETGQLHAGYGVTPPYSLEDPNTKAVSGFSVELLEMIAKQWKVNVVWHRLNWNTFNADLQRGMFDVIGEPIFMTVSRAREISFSEPIDYFPEGVVTVKNDDTRFKKFGDLNASGIKIAVQMGFASEAIAKSQLPNADLIAVAPGTDQLQIFNEVTSGRVDAALTEGGIAVLFVKEHVGVVKLLNLDNPAAWVAGGYALRFEDEDSARSLSVALKSLRLSGDIAALRRKYGLPEANRREQ